MACTLNWVAPQSCCCRAKRDNACRLAGWVVVFCGHAIIAGLQDRVIQAYEGLVYMDFSSAPERVINGLKCYQYARLPVELLPSLYLGYHDTLSEPTEVFHNDIRGRFNRGDPEVVQAMTDLAEITRQCREALLKRDETRIPRISTRRIR